MTMARGELVDSSVTPFYHCISRCVRRARLCGEGCEHRKQWIEDRLKELTAIFAVEVAAYAVLDNLLHVVLKLNDETVAGWSGEDVVRRWGKLFPPRGKDRQPLEVSDDDGHRCHAVSVFILGQRSYLRGHVAAGNTGGHDCVWRRPQ